MVDSFHACSLRLHARASLSCLGTVSCAWLAWRGCVFERERANPRDANLLCALCASLQGDEKCYARNRESGGYLVLDPAELKGL